MRMETNILPEENLLAIDKGHQGVELGTIENKSWPQLAV